MSLTREEILEGIKGLTVAECSLLIKDMEDAFNVSARLPVLPTIQQMELTTEPIEPSRFDLCLTSIGNAKLDVIKGVRSVFQIGLREAKELVDQTPVVLKEGLLYEDAVALQNELLKSGATVELR